MKNEINYKGMQIFEMTDGTFMAKPSIHSAYGVKYFKTLKGAKAHLDSI
jgi:hypothetical protein